MIKWVVSWYIVTQVISGQPITKDPYTGEAQNYQNASAYFTPKEQLMNRIFNTEEDAVKFVNDAPDEFRSKMKVFRLEAVEMDSTNDFVVLEEGNHD